MFLRNSNMTIGDKQKTDKEREKRSEMPERQQNEWNVKMWRRACPLSFFGLHRAPSAWSKSPFHPLSSGEAMIMGSICVCKVQIWAQVQRKLARRSCLLLRIAILLLTGPGSSANCVQVKMQRHSAYRGEFVPPLLKLFGLFCRFNIHPG